MASQRAVWPAGRINEGESPPLRLDRDLVRRRVDLRLKGLKLGIARIGAVYCLESHAIRGILTRSVRAIHIITREYVQKD